MKCLLPVRPEPAVETSCETISEYKYGSTLACVPQFKERVATKHGSQEDPIWDKCFTNLDEGAREVVHPMQA